MKGSRGVIKGNLLVKQEDDRHRISPWLEAVLQEVAEVAALTALSVQLSRAAAPSSTLQTLQFFLFFWSLTSPGGFLI